MRTIFALAFGLAALLTANVVGFAKPQPKTPQPSMTGLWLGSLSVGNGMSLRLVFHFTPGTQGAWSATMTSLDQTPTPIPASQVTRHGADLLVTFPQIHGRLNGTFTTDGKHLIGHWTQGMAVLPLTLTRTNKVPTTRPADEPLPPFPYQSRDVTFANRAAPGVTLAGTLTLPPGPGPFPSAVLISGSGPQTRDEDIFGHRLFFVLADYLTRRGIAVLRYDKRGLGQSTGNYAEATTADFASDARAAVAYLKTVSAVDPKQIGLIGHSEGGLIAPRVAAPTSGIAFVVLMAAPGLTGEQILLQQAALIGRSEGASEAVIASNTELQKQMFATVLVTPDPQQAQKRLHTILSRYATHLPAADKAALGGTQSFADRTAASVSSPWFRSFLVSDPITALRQMRCPVLALNGSHDLQVPPLEDLDAIRAALQAGGNQDYTVQELPGLNHLFQNCRTGALSEYATSPETISPLALRVISDWITKHVSATAPMSDQG
jgi:fermentation-respiration switch protein FrsA (DUF1100 family)